MPEMHAFALQSNGAGIRLMDPGDYFDKRRFSGSVFTHEAVDLPFLQRKVNVIQGPHAGKYLGDMLQMEN
jgi:hypothetical protein